ncbi:MAG TPA: hypothetical protein DCK76_03980, partial [Desulfotomaculum sp.]|nr:hypothetical protein [Desulfotomaculum sp.]
MGQRLIIRWGLNIAGIILTAYLVKGFDVTFLSAIFGFVLLGFINATIRPVLIFLTLHIKESRENNFFFNYVAG